MSKDHATRGIRMPELNINANSFNSLQQDEEDFLIDILTK